MAEVFRVASVQEAVELAQRFKRDGKFDWFRGQVRDWLPRSSLSRLRANGDKDAIDLAGERMALFYGWAKENRSLSYLTEEPNLDQLFAIAQHYGIPTNYIDFTTNAAVAGFFSADAENPSTDGLACIYCLNTPELTDFMIGLSTLPSRKETRLEPIRVEVSNLWRLQAQQGVFLFANYNWEVDYDLEKIVFPYTGYPSYPHRDAIYPKQKSNLEILLDQYFDVEARYFGSRAMRQMVEDIRREGGDVGFLDMNSAVDGVEPEAFLSGTSVAPLESWQSSLDEEWHKYTDENIRTVRNRTEQIYLNADDATSVQQAICYGLLQILDGHSGIRSELVEWGLIGNVARVPTERISEALRTAWNGMRHLPFSNEELASTFSTIAGLVFSGMEADGDRRSNEDLFSAVRGPSISVEFGTADGSVSRGYANAADLRSAMRKDLEDIINPEYRSATQDVRNVLWLVRNPTVLFEFDQFVSIFARDVIPSQILLNRKPTLFNPATMTRFGLP